MTIMPIPLAISAMRVTRNPFDMRNSFVFEDQLDIKRDRAHENYVIVPQTKFSFGSGCNDGTGRVCEGPRPVLEPVARLRGMLPAAELQCRRCEPQPHSRSGALSGRSVGGSPRCTAALSS